MPIFKQNSSPFLATFITTCNVILSTPSPLRRRNEKLLLRLFTHCMPGHRARHRTQSWTKSNPSLPGVQRETFLYLAQFLRRQPPLNIAEGEKATPTPATMPPSPLLPPGASLSCPVLTFPYLWWTPVIFISHSSETQLVCVGVSSSLSSKLVFLTF